MLEVERAADTVAVPAPVAPRACERPRPLHPEMEAVLHAIDRSTSEGRRDFTLLSLAYQTGARVQEILSLRACDLQLSPPAWVR